MKIGGKISLIILVFILVVIIVCNVLNMFSYKMPWTTVIMEGNRNKYDYIRYADEYSDLKRAFGYNIEALERHWKKHGRGEGRNLYRKDDRQKQRQLNDQQNTINQLQSVVNSNKAQLNAQKNKINQQNTQIKVLNESVKSNNELIDDKDKKIGSQRVEIVSAEDELRRTKEELELERQQDSVASGLIVTN